ncbi:hypothetical protein O4160_15390 [Rhodococcus sp. IEGM 1401]|uniref:hypothetical protein n=1 Tax=unclassified Rhodococcus (in: high G+C Gram-positive bacteria) TaxID=192944 RepID=UPI0022B57C91|nr:MULTISPECIES: hypothetical protein [unclassified Rhodococcus (in: high G+C Gram-positive bacteria)]MCZ4562225.1 hypothetical protein [Rhodococcus sp. IEGM 1401]MDI9922268.1 hypothetical protein [Rhodococcus sp. IEGM 1372]MDV8035249.1 hypothetical protein [Rhodococcus sp. IEGM 1414]
MNLVNPTALTVFVVAVTGAYALGILYIRRPSRTALHSNALALISLAVVAATVFALTYPDLAWGWKAALIAGFILFGYQCARMFNSTREEYEASQQRSFVQATVEEDRTNR